MKILLYFYQVEQFGQKSRVKSKPREFEMS